MVLEWAIKLKSRVINQEKMFDNVFDLIFNPVDHPRVSSGPLENKSLKSVFLGHPVWL